MKSHHATIKGCQGLGLATLFARSLKIGSDAGRTNRRIHADAVDNHCELVPIPFPDDNDCIAVSVRLLNCSSFRLLVFRHLITSARFLMFMGEQANLTSHIRESLYSYTRRLRR